MSREWGKPLSSYFSSDKVERLDGDSTQRRAELDKSLAKITIYKKKAMSINLTFFSACTVMISVAIMSILILVFMAGDIAVRNYDAVIKNRVEAANSGFVTENQNPRKSR